MNPSPDPAEFIQQQNQQKEDLLDAMMSDPAILDAAIKATGHGPHSERSLIDEILAQTTAPATSGSLLDEILDKTSTRKARLHDKLAKARQALDAARAVRRAQKEARDAQVKADKAFLKAEKAASKAEMAKLAKEHAKHEKRYSLVRCMRRGAKLLAFTVGWQDSAKAPTAKREYRPKGCALMAAIVGHYGSVEAWKKAGSPYGPAKCKELWPNLTNSEMSNIMDDNDQKRSTREQTAKRLKDAGH